MKNKFLSIIIVFFAQLSFAQERSANILKVEKSGFHQILISPEIRSASNNNLDHLRIFDSKKNEVPYRLLEKRNSTKTYKSFEILSKSAVVNKFTDIVILNKDLEKIDHLSLKIANTDVAKTFNISGSNDEMNWFGLIDNQYIDALSDPKSTFVIREFSFPVNQYKYLKFTFIDKNSSPVNILEAGSEAVLKNSSAPNILNGFTEITNQKKETKQTIIRIEFKEPQIVDAIRFDISAPNFFLRNAVITVPKSRTHKRRTEIYNETVSQFQLKSKTENGYQIPSVFAKEFIITIDNQDNPVLKIDKISLFQNPVSIIAELNQGENYKIAVNQDWKTPQYDLANLGIDFNQNFPVAKVENLSTIDNNKTVAGEKTLWQKPMFMWICILFAVAIIGFFAMGLVKDMNKE